MKFIKKIIKKLDESLDDDNFIEIKFMLYVIVLPMTLYALAMLVIDKLLCFLAYLFGDSFLDYVYIFLQLIIFLMILHILYMQYKIYNRMSISFNDVKEVEYGTKDYDVQKELVKEIKHATLKEVPKIDTSKVGEQTLKFVLTTKCGIEKEVEYKITIKDTKAPENKFSEDFELIVCKDEINCTSKNIERFKMKVDKKNQKMDEYDEFKNVVIILFAMFWNLLGLITCMDILGNSKSYINNSTNLATLATDFSRLFAVLIVSRAFYKFAKEHELIVAKIILSFLLFGLVLTLFSCSVSALSAVLSYL